MSSIRRLSAARFSLVLIAFALTLSGCSFTVVSRGFQCLSYVPSDFDTPEVGDDDFEELELEEQKTEDLCWAAAIQAVLRYHGKDMSQDEIVRKVRGAGGNYSKATLVEVIRGISGDGSRWHVSNGNSAELVADLRAGNPVLLGLQETPGGPGHIVVAYGATYARNPADGGYGIEFVDVWDPWSGVGLDTLDGCEVADDVAFQLHSWRP